MGKRGNSRFPLGTRETNLINRYGIGEDTYKALEQAQNFRCKICREHKRDATAGVLYIDHDHDTGRIRGLLCNQCNQMLGYAKDNQVTLLKAIQYLKGNL